MKKILLLILSLLLFQGCNSIQSLEDADSHYVRFLNTHDFRSNYTISLNMTTSSLDTVKMLFSKKNEHYAREMQTSNGKTLSRSFDIKHTLISIDANGKVKKTYLSKNEERDSDLRRVFTGRLELRKASPKTYEEDDLFVEEFNLNGAIYKYYFEDNDLKKVTISGKDETIILDNITITNTSTESMFEI